jgi:PAS domain S-box-containing protein
MVSNLQNDPEPFRLFIESVRDYAIFMLDTDGRIASWNLGAQRIKGYLEGEVIGRHFSIFYPPEDVARGHPQRELEIAQAEGKYEEEGWPVRKDGTTFYAHVVITAVRDEQGRLRGYGKVTRDVTDRRYADERQKLLLNELNHRVKNTLSIVQSIARQTLGDGKDAKALEARLMALSRAHDMLTAKIWENGYLRTVVTTELEPFRRPSGPQISVEGPDLKLGVNATVAFAMAVHELASNAAKYGAMSQDGGRAELSWGVHDGVVTLDWRESGGPPVAEPTRRGFGAKLLERGLARQINGRAELEFAPEGVRYRMEAPLQMLQSV